MSSGCCGAAQSPNKRANEFFRNTSIKIHIPYGGIQKRKTETVHKTELQDRQMNKKVQRGMEDGLIYGERERRVKLN